MSASTILFSTAAVTWLGSLFLLFRISAFRVDRPGHKGFFGPPIFDFWLGWFDKAAYTAEGQRLFPWLVITVVGTSLLFFLAALIWVGY